jgi:hypothetical protein
MVPVTVREAPEPIELEPGVTVMAEVSFVTVTVAEPCASAKFASPL